LLGTLLLWGEEEVRKDTRYSTQGWYSSLKEGVEIAMGSLQQVQAFQLFFILAGNWD